MTELKKILNERITRMFDYGADYFDIHPLSTEINYSDQIESKLEFDLSATIFIDKEFKGFEVIDGTGADDRDDDDEGDFQTPFINIYFGINPEWLPGEWSEVYFHLADVMRHEIEHITQGGIDHGNYRAGKPSEDDSQLRVLIKLGLLPQAQYMITKMETITTT